MQYHMSETAETFHGCFGVFVSVFYFKCATGVTETESCLTNFTAAWMYWCTPFQTLFQKYTGWPRKV